jgi:hypothetical protein
MIVEINAMVQQYLDHAAFYDQCCDDALDAVESGDDYAEEYYRDLQADEYDAMVALEQEFERLGIDLQELI